MIKGSIIAILVFIFGCGQQQAKYGNSVASTLDSLKIDTLLEDKGVIHNNEVKGDFNGDGKLDYMWLQKPKLKSEDADCVDECTTYIKFSDQTIPSIEITSCIDGDLSNEGDLNKNGTDEIGLLPYWFSSCWRVYHVWTFKNGGWINAVEPFETHCNQWAEGVKPIEIDLKKEGYVIIRYSEFSSTTENWTKSKSVKIAK